MTTTRKQTRTPRRRPAVSPLRVLPDESRVRWSRIQTAQARIASGYYERDEVQEFVVEAILRELSRR